MKQPYQQLMGKVTNAWDRQMREGDVETFLYAKQPLGVGQVQVGSGGEIDSLQGLELTLAIEERYGIRLTDGDLTSNLLRSIPRLAHVVASRLGSETRK